VKKNINKKNFQKQKKIATKRMRVRFNKKKSRINLLKKTISKMISNKTNSNQNNMDKI